MLKRDKTLLAILGSFFLLFFGILIGASLLGKIGIWGAEAQTYKISGIVYDDQGKIVQGAIVDLFEVQINNEDNTKTRIPTGQTKLTNVNGLYEFTAAGKKCYVALGTHPTNPNLYGYSKAIKLINNISDADIHLSAAIIGSISGQVLDIDTKKPILGVSLSFVNSSDNKTFNFTTGAGGFEGQIDKGNYIVSFFHSDYERGIERVEVKVGQENKFTFYLKKKTTPAATPTPQPTPTSQPTPTPSSGKTPTPTPSSGQTPTPTPTSS